MDAITATVQSQSFIQAIIVLMATALLTGLGAPTIMANINARKLREQKIFEVGLAQQTKIIDAQAKLLDDLSDTLWAFHAAVASVSYYRSYGPDMKIYEEKLEKYDTDGWTLLTAFRSEVSRAHRLATPTTYQTLVDFYYKFIVPEVDSRLARLTQKPKSTPDEWCEFHDFVYTQVPKRIDHILRLLAEDFDLAVSASPLSSSTTVAR